MAELAAKPEYHAFLDELCRQNVYGSVTFFFKNGDIVLVKDQLEYNTRQILEAFSGSHPRHILVIQKKQTAISALSSEKSGVEKGENEGE